MANSKFPSNFIWSAATSSFQIEGAWNIDGKGPSIWDTFCHEEPSRISDKSSGDVACDSYHQFDRDVEIIKELAVHAYRFSISWPRIMPRGERVHGINSLGVDYYHKMIDLLLANGITPHITLFHWDLPQALQDKGGWVNPECVEWFCDYARFCFTEFGSKVKFWITFNEVKVSTCLSCCTGAFAPGIVDSSGTVMYMMARNCLLAHGKVYRMYESDFKLKQNGRVGLTGDTFCHIPFDPDSSDDVAAAERANEFELGLWCGPALSDTGDYPEIVKETINRRSVAQGLAQSRLIPFSPQEKKLIANSVDFFGLNYYTARYAKAKAHNSDLDQMNFDADTEVEKIVDPKWKLFGHEHFACYPEGIRYLLKWFKEKYGNIPVLITENGCSDTTGSLNDDFRVEFIEQHLRQILQAINIDHCNVIGYTAWSLMDNFEWNSGYKLKFGLYNVDFSDPNRKRTPKKSAEFYQDIVSNNGFV